MSERVWTWAWRVEGAGEVLPQWHVMCDGRSIAYCCEEDEAIAIVDALNEKERRDAAERETGIRIHGVIIDGKTVIP